MLVGQNAKRMLGPLVTSPSQAIEIHENVPETEPYFHRMNVMLYATESGSGMKVKVMEAVAFGTPVVTNADGVEGLPVEDGVHMGIAEDDAALVERTLRLLQDSEGARRQSENARQLLERYCHPEVVLDAHEQIFRRLTMASG